MEKKTRTQLFVGERVIGGKCSERTIIVKCCVNVTPQTRITAILQLYYLVLIVLRGCGSPCWTFAPRDRSFTEMGILNVQGVVDPRDGHCLHLITLINIYV